MAPTNILLFLIIGLSGLYVLLHRSVTPFSAALVGFFFSLGYFGFSLSWIGNALLVEGNPYWWAWPLAVSGLPIILSAFTALACYIHKRICKDKNNYLTFILFVILIFSAELMRGTMFTGFPWNLYGYTWIDILPIAQISGLYNIYLLSFVTIFWCASPAYLLTAQNHKILKLLISLFVVSTLIASYLWGLTIMQRKQDDTLEPYGFKLVQPNFAQSEKWKMENRTPNFLKLVELSKYNESDDLVDKKAYYIIWPETAISQDLLNSEWVYQSITSMLSQYPAPAYLITGALRYEKEKYYNSVIIFNNEARIIDTYDKSHLVPFGEYMPLSNIINIAPIVGFSGFESGNGKKAMVLPEGIKFTPLICYEIIFPELYLINNRNKSDFIINVTNDAWYGQSAGPYQHLAQTQFRAIENQIPIFRAANTGISAAISSTGKIIYTFPLSTP